MDEQNLTEIIGQLTIENIRFRKLIQSLKYENEMMKNQLVADQTQPTQSQPED